VTELRALGGFDSPFGRSSTPIQNPYSDPALFESDADKSFSQSTLQQTAQKRVQSNDIAIAQREQEINEIAKGIIELADIFKDLQTMVIDQGTMLDRIDYNVERMVADVKGAEKELVVVCIPLSSSDYCLAPVPSVVLRHASDCCDLISDIVLHTGHELSAPFHEAQDTITTAAARHSHVHPAPRQAEETFADVHSCARRT